MPSDIVSALNLDNHLIVNKFLFATKDACSDLNFFFSDFLSYYLRKNYSVIIVNLAQSHSHYTHLLLKSGINIKVIRDSQKVAFVDVMLEAGNLIESTVETDSENTDLFNSLNNSSLDTHCLKPLYECIKKTIAKISALKPDGIIVFIDEISMLMNLGTSLLAVQPFVQQCFVLCSKFTDISANLVIGSFYDETDPENQKMVNYFTHMADIRIQVQSLKTGYSKDTDGKICFEVKNKKDCTYIKQKLFFKIHDKGAKLLTLGL
ncbi:elongator complex protein 6-like [Argiope bruennichi]|uniref:Elongator complex protein 6 n=1 Tax=Argiope bruennichi TaxID=94029 RepID=A0A8T0ECW3_ARGBR|nr:elongator complex protein 6-like [Argiope bruennichi]KAF8767985.1 Elongator complex protein 6 like protein [Argiope bruennichi]